MSYDPILIAAPTRCGTTLTAGLLYHHGVWVGKAHITAFPETNSLLGTENIDIKHYLKNYRGQVQFKRDILSKVHTDGPWLVKTVQNLFKWKIWNEYFPNATWIIPKRDINAIVASAMKHPSMRRTGSAVRREIVAEHQAIQDLIIKSVSKQLSFDVNRLGQGDLTLAREIVEFCDLTFDESIAKNWINPDMWHHAR